MSDLTSVIGGGFNAAEVEPANDNSPLPAGEYYVEVESAVLKDTANGQGKGLNTQFNVLGSVADQSQSGRKLFNWFNLQHSNETAEKIGRSEFAALCLAVGKPTVTDTDELLGVPLIVKVAIDKKDAERNVIKAYKNSGEASEQAAAAPTPPPAQATPAATAKKPWEK